MIRHVIEKKILIQMQTKKNIVTKVKLWYNFNFKIKKMIKDLEYIDYNDLLLIFGLVYHKELLYNNDMYHVQKVDDNAHRIIVESGENILTIYIYAPNNTGCSYIDILWYNKHTNNEYKTGYWYKEHTVQNNIKTFVYEVIKRYYKGEI